MDKHRQYVEWALNIRLSEQGIRQFRKSFEEAWSKSDPTSNRNFADGINNGYEVMKNILSINRLDVYHRWLHFNHDCFLGAIEKSGSVVDQWIYNTYKSIYKIGGKFNPVLAPGDPPLTLLMAERYCDFIESAVDLSMSGGLIGPEREVLKGYLVNSWGRDDASKQDVLGALKEWHELALKPCAERVQWQNAMGSRFSAQMRAHPQLAMNQWLIARTDRERALFEQQNAVQREKLKLESNIIRMQDEVARTIIGNMSGSTWRYRYYP